MPPLVLTVIVEVMRVGFAEVTEATSARDFVCVLSVCASLVRFCVGETLAVVPCPRGPAAVSRLHTRVMEIKYVRSMRLLKVGKK